MVLCVVQLLEWHQQLDGGLPDPLGSVGVWLHQAEKILREELVPQQSHEETANAIQQTRQLHQVDEKSQQGEREMRNGVSMEENAGLMVMDVHDFVFPRRSSALPKRTSRPSSVFTGT